MDKLSIKKVGHVIKKPRLPLSFDSFGLPVFPTTRRPIVGGGKPMVNGLCPCGSGKKYKKCCGGEKKGFPSFLDIFRHVIFIIGEFLFNPESTRGWEQAR